MVNPVANILTEKLCISVSAMDQDCPNEVFIVEKIILWRLKSGIFYSYWTGIKNVQIEDLPVGKC